MISLELEDKEMDYIAQVLGTRPYSEVAPLMAKISVQVQVQKQQQAPVVEEEEGPAKPRAVN